MKNLLSFENYISEKYQLNPNDAPEITSQKRGFNDIENFIKEYQNKKVTLDNIYKTYKDDKDLINKLKSQNLLEGNPGNVKTIRFTNPLLAIHAQISRKMREIADVQNIIKSDEETLKSKDTFIDATQSTDTKEVLKDEISDTESKIGDNQEKIKKLDSEIMILKKQIDLEINKLKKQLIDSQRRINTEQFT